VFIENYKVGAQIVVAVGNDVQWRRFCKAIGRDDLAADQRLAKVKGRVTRRNELIPELCRTMLTHNTEFWIERLEAEHVPCGPINDYAQVFADPQVLHRKLRVDIPAAGGASVSTAASPLRLTSTPPRYDLAPPALGEHTDSVLTNLLGKTVEEIGALRRDGII
jgi:crotonobetainyl-CoA:carnitine CoA-transferase CaiB-like acyl-CoA transferase